MTEPITYEDSPRLREWVAALRSGSYQQGRERLHYVKNSDEPEHKFCCLGVLSKISGAEQCRVTSDGAFAYGEERNATFEPLEARQWLGLSDGDTLYIPCSLLDGRDSDPKALLTKPLFELNDSGFTFDQIADLIQRFGVTTGNSL